MDVNWVLSVLPRPFTTVMIASAMPAAIKPYSIAVAPDWSNTNFKMVRFKTASCERFAETINPAEHIDQVLRFVKSDRINFSGWCPAHHDGTAWIPIEYDTCSAWPDAFTVR
jgi:hypothetical protein